jgi:hypothetical protein
MMSLNDDDEEIITFTMSNDASSKDNNNVTFSRNRGISKNPRNNNFSPRTAVLISFQFPLLIRYHTIHHEIMPPQKVQFDEM